MTRSGYSGASTGMHSIGALAANAGAADGDITLFSDNLLGIYVDCMLCATRDGNNQALMTWNAKLLDNCSMYKMYRILTPNNPAGIKFVDNFNPDAVPGNILSGLGNYDYKSISVDEGDLYRDWINADAYEGYYVGFLFIYKVSNQGVGIFRYLKSSITNYCIGSAPSLTYDQSSNSFTLGTSMAGKRILEFHRTDCSYGYPTSITNQNTLNEMFLTSFVIGEEGGNGLNYYQGYYNINNNKLARWAKGSYTVGVNFKDNTNKSRISAAINFALSEINSVLNNYGVYFTRSSTATSGDITITVDTEYNLYGIDPSTAGYVYAGQWKTHFDSNGYIYSADITLATDFFEYVPFYTYEHAAMEELSQAMGAGYDQSEYVDNTIHVELNYFNKPDYLTPNDINILQLVYSDEVSAGSSCTQVSKAFNIPKGVYLPSNSTVDSAMNVSASFLDSDASYAVRAFIVNSSGKVSYTSDWINITTPSNLRPADWEWMTNVSKGAAVSFYNGAIRPLTAAEWNAFTTRINEFRKYMGLSEYSFTTVNSNTNFTAAIYNEAVAAIKGISGYGTYLSYATAGVTDALLSSNYTSLRDELNAIP